MGDLRHIMNLIFGIVTAYVVLNLWMCNLDVVPNSVVECVVLRKELSYADMRADNFFFMKAVEPSVCHD